MEFSIIIPAKNEEVNIAICLDSIGRLIINGIRYEIIVIDNGSSDRTVEVAKSKGALVFEKPNMTIAALRNFGVSQAKGMIIAFLDADCTVASDWLSAASRYLENNEVVCFGCPPGNPAPATWVQRAWYCVRRKEKAGQDVRWLESMNMFVPRSVFVKVGGFNQELVTCEDYDFSLRLRRCGKIIADDRIVAVHHGEARNILHFFLKEHWRGTSNFQGMKSHGFHLEELPSLLFPVVYCVIFIAMFGYLSFERTSIFFIIMLISLLQIPIVVFAAMKTQKARDLKKIPQLILLLNVYLLARGSSVLLSKKISFTLFR